MKHVLGRLAFEMSIFRRSGDGDPFLMYSHPCTRVLWPTAKKHE